MGAYLFYRTHDQTITAANEAQRLFDQHHFNQKLYDCYYGGFTVTSQDDLDWALQADNPKYWMDYFNKKIGEGDYKFSGIDEDVLVKELKLNTETFFERCTEFFEFINDRIPMKYLARSCAFSSHYFSDQQIARITFGGSLLSGDNKETIINRIKKYPQLKLVS